MNQISMMSIRTKILQKTPMVVLFIILSVNIYLFMTSSSPLNQYALRTISDKFIKEDQQSFFIPTSYYAEKDPDLVSAGKFLEENIPENGRLMYENDRNSSLGMLDYHVINFFIDKKIRTFFYYHIPVSESVTVGAMKQSSAEYYFSYKNPNPIFESTKGLENKSILLRLENDKLKLVKSYE